jgi:hypothetical protein
MGGRRLGRLRTAGSGAETAVRSRQPGVARTASVSSGRHFKSLDIGLLSSKRSEVND